MAATNSSDNRNSGLAGANGRDTYAPPSVRGYEPHAAVQATARVPLVLASQRGFGRGWWGHIQLERAKLNDAIGDG